MWSTPTQPCGEVLAVRLITSNAAKARRCTETTGVTKPLPITNHRRIVAMERRGCERLHRVAVMVTTSLKMLDDGIVGVAGVDGRQRCACLKR